jgi:MFS family permease
LADIPEDQTAIKPWTTHFPALSALLLLALINLLNHVDRRALVTLFPLIKLEWGVSDAQLGLAVSLLTLGRALMAFPAGWLADRLGILRVLRTAALLWAALAALSGRAGSFAVFIGLRTGVGLMDGANNPLDLAYLGKNSPKSSRGVYLAVYSMALYFGSGLGLVYAGAFGERYGWRWALALPGLLGLLAALGLFLLPKQARPPGQAPAPQKSGDFSWLLAKPLPVIFLGGALGVFATTALVSWLPSYLTRHYELSLTQAGLVTGVLIPASVLGTLAGGLLSDRLGKRDASARFRLSGGMLVLAMAFGLGGLSMPDLTGTVAFFFLSAFSITVPVSPLLVLVQGAVPGERLATAQAAFGLATQVLGAAPATSLVGLLSDQLGLRLALVLPFIAAGLGGVLIAAGTKIRGIPRDL